MSANIAIEAHVNSLFETYRGGGNRRIRGKGGWEFHETTAI